MLGAFEANTWVAFFAATGLILGAAYALYLYRRIIFGALTKDNLKSILDLSPREWLLFAPLVIVVVWMGVYPVSFLDIMHVSVENLVNQVETAQAAAASAAQLAVN